MFVIVLSVMERDLRVVSVHPRYSLVRTPEPGRKMTLMGDDCSDGSDGSD